MSHFYGTLQGNRGPATRQGTKRTGLSTVAASWRGAIKVYIYIDQQGRDCFKVYQEPWYGAGISQDIAQGIIGVNKERYETMKADALQAKAFKLSRDYEKDNSHD